MSELALSQASPAAHMLPYTEVGRIISEVGLPAFISELSDEIAAVYRDPAVESLDRTGWNKGFSTSEVMLCQDENYRVCKIIGSNPETDDGPTVAGTMVMYGRDQASPLLMCDATLTTALRTATTTALVLGELKPGIETLSVIGTGFQGQSHAVAAALTLPGLKRILLRDIQPGVAEEARDGIQAMLKGASDGEHSDIDIAIAGLDDPAVETEPDAIVTATFGTKEVLTDPDRLKRGVIVAAIGADMAGKRELNPEIYRKAKFVTDELRQSLREGELQHAAKQLGITELHEPLISHHGSLLGGWVIGVTELLEDPTDFMNRDEHITIYDSTGFAGQDLAVGKLLLRMLEGAN